MANKKNIIDQSGARKGQLGLLFGFMAGLAFSLTTWLPDAMGLARSHAVLPWLKFGIGSVCTIPFFSLAGWIAIHKQSLLVTALCFGAACFLSVLLAGHLPFEISLQAIRLVDPGLSRLISLPFHEGAMTRTVLTAILNLVLVLIASLFFEYLVSQAYLSISRINVITPLLIFMVFFAVNGIVANDLNNKSINTPIVRMSALIQEAQKIQGGQRQFNSKGDAWVDTILTLGINVQVPYRILVEKYDTTFTQLELLIQFGQDWYRCNMMEDQPFYCSTIAGR